MATAALPNPFIDPQSASTSSLSSADQLAAHVDHDAVLSIRETQRDCVVVRSVALPADVVAELDAALAEIVAEVASPLFLRDPSPEFLAASGEVIRSC